MMTYRPKGKISLGRPLKRVRRGRRRSKKKLVITLR
jgi:hypothetical protein